MPFTKTVVPGSKLPPLDASYHLIFVPIAIRSFNVPALQIVCVALPNGAAGVGGCAFIPTGADGSEVQDPCVTVNV